MSVLKLTAQDKRWRAEDDARTLATANVIQDDPTRLTAAKRAAIRIAKEEKERANAMRKVATKKGSGTTKTPPKKKTKKSSKEILGYHVFEHIR